MRTIMIVTIGIAAVASCANCARAQQAGRVVEIKADELEDKIRGGMLAQIIGNLNGLPHEFKYIDKPGNVKHFTPYLPEGAYTDDDTDIEWVYVHEIARSGEPMLPPDRIAALWKRHINRRIWAANRYARDLMELGFEPPWTGNEALNPFAEFNISGQFICESFGLMAPAMPQTAARLGLNYTHTTINGEPAQTTQLFTTMIATAFVENDLDRILDAGVAAVDPKSRIAEVVLVVRKLCRDNPEKWRVTRQAIHDRWQTNGGGVRDRNGYELNTASTIAALCYGQKDFRQTLRMACTFGWDADNNAATSATIIGVMKGRRWMNSQEWRISDVYKNTSRDDMPNEETITSFENKLIECARIVIKKQGGSFEPSPPGRGQGEGDSGVYRIHTEAPANIEPLSTSDAQIAEAREKLLPLLDKNLTEPGPARARAAYIAICLGEVDRQKQKNPAAWSTAVDDLQKQTAIVKQLFTTTAPGGERLRHEAERAGLKAPKVD